MYFGKEEATKGKHIKQVFPKKTWSRETFPLRGYGIELFGVSVTTLEEAPTYGRFFLVFSFFSGFSGRFLLLFVVLLLAFMHRVFAFQPRFLGLSLKAYPKAFDPTTPNQKTGQNPKPLFKAP